jgi:rubredoxin-NAD+ reductase
MTKPILIIGSGLAGYTLAREFRKLDREAPLVIVSRDAAGFYSKPMLSNALSANKTPATLVMKDATRMTEDLNATIRAHCEVRSIDVVRSVVTLDNGEEIAWRDLVLAGGADPIRLPIEGDGAADVLSVNDLDDFARFSARLNGARRIAVLGAGLIGCEFANDLLARDIEPVVMDIAEWPLGRLLPEEAGKWFQQRLEKTGVSFHMKNSATTISRVASGYRLDMQDGTRIEADLVLSAVGLRPRTSLALAAGLAINRGVKVNRRLATSTAHVYAMGDCAEVEGLTLPFVMPIMFQARALAATLAGTPTELNYPAMPVVVKTPACPTVVCPPEVNAAGGWEVDRDENDSGLEARYIASDGRLLGFALLGTATARKQAIAALAPAMLD